MRTVIFIGLLSIAFAINPKENNSEYDISFFAVVFVIISLMDILDFVKSHFKK